jgi:hypothetical protein
MRKGNLQGILQDLALPQQFWHQIWLCIQHVTAKFPAKAEQGIFVLRAGNLHVSREFWSERATTGAH